MLGRWDGSGGHIGDGAIAPGVALLDELDRSQRIRTLEVHQMSGPAHRRRFRRCTAPIAKVMELPLDRFRGASLMEKLQPRPLHLP